MALTIRQLSSDASFLLTFEPIETSDVALSTQPFHVLLDPRDDDTIATGAGEASCFQQPVRDLPEIDMVLVSSARREHCHEATLRQLPARTRVLAVPAAARRISSWRHFDAAAVEALPRWDDDDAARSKTGSSSSSRDSVLRIPILPHATGGEPGELTLTCIGRKREAALGLTYRPPTVSPSTMPRCRATPTGTVIPLLARPPPGLPTPALSFSNSGRSSPVSSASSSGSPPFAPATPPPKNGSSGSGNSGSLRRQRTVARSCRSPRLQSPDRGVSVVFAPRGIPYRLLQGYATTHLLGQAVLPLTALLHCFDAQERSPWYSLGGGGHGRAAGGGVPAGQETASALGALAWIGAHGGSGSGGIGGSGGGGGGRFVKRRRYCASEVQRILDTTFAQGTGSTESLLRRSAGHHRTEVFALGPGDEITMTSEGIWEEETLFAGKDGGGKEPLGMLGLGVDMVENEEGRILGGALPVDWIGATW
ncbi:hypothetical protein IF1G_04553 [Cordyceps javanica]|uniref:Beta-lactamase superfamily domain-containing protein n=1 Tax=Cordyceps javanica TaxID=43265 RepID=A0A545V6I6_9HYPO|nr:hypothetical protein IF1G_04553 [Cordyceps javanica]TQW08555.1 beta-lactamase superfamily domain-containing protein [Cordyceps javanica]